jgi:ABC-2 type transport system permease protein
MYIWLTALAVVLIILLPVAAAVITRRRWGAPWIYLCAGILTFIAAQVIHLPLNRLLRAIGLLPDQMPEGTELIWTALALGITAALSEELIRTAGYAILKKARKFGDGIMLGLGHSGIEAMIVAILLAASAGSFYYFQNTELLPEIITSEALLTIQRAVESAADNPLLALTPLLERTLGLVFQVIFSILVLHSFRTRKWGYVLIAIFYHALVDFTALVAFESLESIWLVELILLVLLIPGLIWYWKQRNRSLDEAQPQQVGLGAELPVLRTSLSKEWLYQRRTKRLIIVIAVFLLFGMISPILAKYTPQLLSNIEGAEQFAALVPEPAVSDAIAQYISNLTQFGFILAILLGMGAIAGEKEKGTAAMVLSKPLPRWVFLSSKFLSQAFVFFVALGLSALAAYYYTLFLFEALDVVAFILASLLLYLWLLVFTVITLLGSSLGRTTGAAAGISAAIGILILLAGSIPKYGILAPSGLITWAGQLALDSSVQPNTGGVVTAVVVILLALITSIAVLEQQEI